MVGRQVGRGSIPDLAALCQGLGEGIRGVLRSAGRNRAVRNAQPPTEGVQEQMGCVTTKGRAAEVELQGGSGAAQYAAQLGVLKRSLAAARADGHGVRSWAPPG